MLSYVDGAVVLWSALSPYSRKVLGLNSGVCIFSPVLFFSRFSPYDRWDRLQHPRDPKAEEHGWISLIPFI